MEIDLTSIDGIKEHMHFLGAPDLDLSSYTESETFAGICKNHARYMKYAEDSKEVLTYWKSRGLRKELHNVTDYLPDKWASYLPLESFDHPDKKYPLLFVMHGAGNPIYLAETYGYTEIAAREKLITIIPEDETPENMEKLFSYAREHYPVDWTRIYMVGYSLGAVMTSRLSLRWPNRFAALGSGGIIYSYGYSAEYIQGGKPWPGETLTDEMAEAAQAYRLPVCICMGEQEMLHLLPLTEDQPLNPWIDPDVAKASLAEYLTGTNKIHSINNWRRINGCSVIPEADVRREVAHTADIVTEKLGFPFDRTSVIQAENRSHYVGDSIGSDGKSWMRVVGMGKSPHWPSQFLAEITWDFIKQFAVCPETGVSYRMEQ